MAAFASYNIVNNNAAPVTQSDWLISSQIKLGEGNELKFWAKQVTNQYGNEKFKVLISDTDTNTTNFTAISQGTNIELNGINWVEYTYIIPTSYDFKDVYLAIQCVSHDAFIFMIDDLKLQLKLYQQRSFITKTLKFIPTLLLIF